MICNHCSKPITKEHVYASVALNDGGWWYFHIDCYVQYLFEKKLDKKLQQYERKLVPKAPLN